MARPKEVGGGRVYSRRTGAWMPLRDAEPQARAEGAVPSQSERAPSKGRPRKEASHRQLLQARSIRIPPDPFIGRDGPKHLPKTQAALREGGCADDLNPSTYAILGMYAPYWDATMRSASTTTVPRVDPFADALADALASGARDTIEEALQEQLEAATTLTERLEALGYFFESLGDLPQLDPPELSEDQNTLLGLWRFTLVAAESLLPGGKLAEQGRDLVAFPCFGDQITASYLQTIRGEDYQVYWTDADPVYYYSEKELSWVYCVFSRNDPSQNFGKFKARVRT